jgi:adenylyltransferase/sulfurtransferase
MINTINERYARQAIFSKIGADGQNRIGSSHAALIGLGALGSVIADELARAGVGFMRLIDRDYVEFSNLQRQVLYTEADAQEQLPKAIAAEKHLRAANSQIGIEPVVADVNAANIERLIDGVEIVIDGTDNFETRFLINEACHKHRIPWVYGGAIGSSGAVTSFLPGRGACLQCLSPKMPAAGSYPTCSTEGILGMASAATASIEAAEALKIMIGSPDAMCDFLNFDLWTGKFEKSPAERDPDCPVCGKGIYELLDAGAPEEYVLPLCAEGSFQITPQRRAEIELRQMEEK